MLRRSLISAGLGPLTALLILPSGLLAGAVHPRLLAYAPDDNALGFVVRPKAMQIGASTCRFEHIVGPGTTLAGYDHGKAGRIRWLRFAASALGRATAVQVRGHGACYFGLRALSATPVTVRAWRVRAGRYTRLTIRGRRSRRPPVFELRDTRLPRYGRRRLHAWCRVGIRRCVTPG